MSHQSSPVPECSYNRLYFGVSLDKFGNDLHGVHPVLLHVFETSYFKIRDSGHSVKKAVKSLQGSLHERLTLKENVVLGKNLSKLNCPPGAFLWIIRHFIGLLPTELLAKRIGNAKYNWSKLSKLCAMSLCDYYALDVNNKELTYKLTTELLRLPPDRFLFMITLINFLRMLTVMPKGEPLLNRKTLVVLVKYYTASIFIRPFRPGSVIKGEILYYSLTAYLIIRWSDIQDIILETCNYSCGLSPTDSLCESRGQCGSDTTLKPTAAKRVENIATSLKYAYNHSVSKMIIHQYKPPELNDNWSQTKVLDKYVQNMVKTEIDKRMYCCCAWNFCNFAGSMGPDERKINTSNDKKCSSQYNFINVKDGSCNNIELLDYSKPIKTETAGKIKEQFDGSNALRENLAKELKIKFALRKGLIKNDGDSYEKEKEKELDNSQEIPNKRNIFKSKFEFLRVLNPNIKWGFSQLRNEIKYQKMSSVLSLNN